MIMVGDKCFFNDSEHMLIVADVNERYITFYIENGDTCDVRTISVDEFKSKLASE